MSSQYPRLILALVAASLAAAPALAADTTFTNASTAVKKPEPKFTDYVTMDMTVFYSGASVTGLGSPYVPTPDGYDDTTTEQNFVTRFRPAYKIMPGMLFGPVFEWSYIPVHGGDYSFGNIFARFVYSKLVDQPQFKVYSEGRFYFPTTEASQKDDFLFGARAYLDMTYAVPKSSLTLGYEHYLRGDTWGSNVKENKRLVEYWWGPYVNYDFSSVLSAKLQVDGTFKSVTGSDELKTDPTHLRAGIGIMPIGTIFLAPHIYAPVKDFSWSATVFNIEAWAKLF